MHIDVKLVKYEIRAHVLGKRRAFRRAFCRLNLCRPFFVDVAFTHYCPLNSSVTWVFFGKVHLTLVYYRSI